MKTAAKATPTKHTKNSERPLVEDIRLLGRMLGDVIREQDGEAAFALVEQVRTLSVAFRRDADQEAESLTCGHVSLYRRPRSPNHTASLQAQR